MTNVCINQKENAIYPTKNTLFRPSIAYPEYLFKEDISNKTNDVYEMIRTGFYMLGFDKENFNTPNWNPLKDKIKPGDNVLIKPNMVLHSNISGCGEECLYTHPSLVATIIDYALIALKGTGKIIVGDAPLQECNFEKLIDESGYRNLIDYYKKKKIDIELVDFRNVKTYEKNRLHYLQEEEGDKGVVVQLNENSVFYGTEDEKIKNLRITNYDPRILQKHHNATKHEYNVSKYVLDADVIINMPKPKTHRKAGVTISLKNLVGINANKEYLPHHSLGSVEEGGDAYSNKNYYLSKANEILDLRNELVHNKDMDIASLAEKLYEVLLNKGKKISDEKYWEGSWYGNNTIWKTITDLNRILLYADKNGIIQDYKQRKLFIVGDMIVSGQKEGPLEPVPIYPKLVVLGDDPLYFDRVVCSIMGFNYKLIPSLSSPQITQCEHSISNEKEYHIISNNKQWNNNSCEEIFEKYSVEFQPTMGWIEKLGNKYVDRLAQKLADKDVYIFGAGINGKYAASVLKNKGVKVIGFFDNNKELWETMVIDGISCHNPATIKRGTIIVGGIKDRYESEIKQEILKYGGIYVGNINRG